MSVQGLKRGPVGQFSAGSGCQVSVVATTERLKDWKTHKALLPVLAPDLLIGMGSHVDLRTHFSSQSKKNVHKTEGGSIEPVL